MAQALPLPRVAFVPVVGDHDDEEEEGHKLRAMLAFLFGMGGGPRGEGMPRDVFRVVLDLLMPPWDPLRYKFVEIERIRLLMLGLAGKIPKLMRMTEAELRHWVIANPNRVNDRDRETSGNTALYVAAGFRKSLPLTVWLVDEKGTDANATTSRGLSALYEAYSLDIVTALLDRGADPIPLDNDGVSPLMRHAWVGRVKVVARLLRDPRVRATINIQSGDGRTALHCACRSTCISEERRAALVILLLQCGADYTRSDADGRTPLALLQQSHYPHHVAIAVLEQAPDAEKASLLIKARRHVVAADSNAALPTSPQGRVVRGQPLLRVALVAVAGGNNGEEETSKLRSVVSFLLGIGGAPEGKTMPGRAFRVVINLLMPSRDPLCRPAAGLEEGKDAGGGGSSKTKGKAGGQGMCMIWGIVRVFARYEKEADTETKKSNLKGPK